MIRLFRQLRKQLPDKNKISGYLAYAVGEILLVVIGILIAVQVNSWKSEADENHQTIANLESMLFDLQQDDERMQTLDSFYREKADLMRILLDTDSGGGAYDNDFLGKSFNRSMQYRKFSQKKSTYLSLISDGSLNKARDKALIDQIIIYYERPYLTWSTEIYQNRVEEIDFNQSEIYDSRDLLILRENTNAIPGWTPSRKVFQTDYNQLMRTQWAINILSSCLSQANYIFKNIESSQALNRDLASAIHKYIEKFK
jgi:hypothetical protein